MDYRRRLAIISSHLRPVASCSRSGLRPLPASSCPSVSDERPRVNDGEKRSSKRDCVFCKIIRGESPAVRLYEDEKCLCILDSKPLTPGHCLIIPKSHYSSLETTPPHVVAAMCSKAPFIGSAIMRATSCDSFNLLVNNGAAAGQVIFHTHIHIIPRKESDCLWTSESIRRRQLNFDHEAYKLVERVRAEMLSSNTLEETKGQESILS
ncbi:hypothetical protein SAY87_003341 [Trapa incisa]|uniref:HIT domain-containing protein n=2 Tax=Trapa TaxID=22665 RepID=A0AAN7QTP7_TRANT|nr:hypothetical protein SAY87_003341 [Trapa incisa]KAK4779419.1 hypothetical protein SAY86_006947 [Trapa natans]